MEIREKIIRTVSFFDLFDHPLTRAEILDKLYGKDAEANETDIAGALNALIATGILKENNKCVFFADRQEDLPALREARRIISARKWKRAKRWAKFFSGLPGVELVGVGNTLAYDNAKDGSDIDLFIVTAPGKIWRTRFFCAAISAIFGLRPSNGNNRDKLCLSFFVTEDALDLSKLMRDGSDVYMHYWIKLMVPLAGSAKGLRHFLSVNPDAAPAGRIMHPLFWRLLLCPLALLPGAFMKNWQHRHFPEELRKIEEKHDGSVIISDSILKFHLDDRRADIYERWEKRVNLILNETRQTN